MTNVGCTTTGSASRIIRSSTLTQFFNPNLLNLNFIKFGFKKFENLFNLRLNIFVQNKLLLFWKEHWTQILENNGGLPSPGLILRCWLDKCWFWALARQMQVAPSRFRGLCHLRRRAAWARHLRGWNNRRASCLNPFCLAPGPSTQYLLKDSSISTTCVQTLPI